MEYSVTIYSAADKEEHNFVTKNPEAVSTRLIGQMEVGSWFKIERIV